MFISQRMHTCTNIKRPSTCTANLSLICRTFLSFIYLCKIQNTTKTILYVQCTTVCKKPVMSQRLFCVIRWSIRFYLVDSRDFSSNITFSLLYQPLTSKTVRFPSNWQHYQCPYSFFFGNVTRLLESNSYVRYIFIDFSKAFDTVFHEILLQKLVTLKFPQCVMLLIVPTITNDY